MLGNIVLLHESVLAKVDFTLSECFGIQSL